MDGTSLMMRRHYLAAIILMITGIPLSTLADSPVEAELQAARETFAVGVEFAEEGRWERAIQAFREVMEVMPAAPVRYNLAMVLLRHGDFPEAEDLVESLLIDEETSPELQAEAVGLLMEMEEAGGRIYFNAPDTTEAILIDGYAIGPENYERGYLMSAGLHLIETFRDGRIISRRRVEIRGGGELRVTLSAQDPLHFDLSQPAETTTKPLEAAPAPAKRERPGWVRNKWTGIGVGAAVLLGVGLGVGLSVEGNPDPFVGDLQPGQLRW